MQLTLIEKKKEAEDVTSFVFKPEIPFSWKPGQFLHYTLKHKNYDSRGPDRYFTIASAPFEQVVIITTRFAKDGSSFKKALKSFKIGDHIEGVAPDGNFTLDDPNQKSVFIAGGIGITPFRSILLDFVRKNIPVHVTLLYANKTADFVYKEELKSIAKQNPNLKIHFIAGPKRIAGNTVKKTVANLKRPIFYVSGPQPMVESIDIILEGLGVRKNHIKNDFFPGYD